MNSDYGVHRFLKKKVTGAMLKLEGKLEKRRSFFYRKSCYGYRNHEMIG